MWQVVVPGLLLREEVGWGFTFVGCGFKFLPGNISTCSIIKPFPPGRGKNKEHYFFLIKRMCTNHVCALVFFLSEKQILYRECRQRMTL